MHPLTQHNSLSSNALSLTVLYIHALSSFIEFDHIDMPTFFRDRDFISRVVIRSDHAAREVVFRFQPADDHSAPATGHLRGEVINMTFALRSIERDTRTRVDAEFLCDPKGWIPAWLVNFFLRDWPKTSVVTPPFTRSALSRAVTFTIDWRFAARRNSRRETGRWPATACRRGGLG